MDQHNSKNNIYNIIIVGVLISLFCVYNVLIYTSKHSSNSSILSKKASYGQQLWRDNNCWACHQIYGLGGYLGPDLTNVYSKSPDGDNYIKAFLNMGVRSMPKFNFTEREKEAIVHYLRHIDSTGYYPNYSARTRYNGWVEIKTKDEN